MQFRATRLRLSGEIAWLRAHGYLRLLAVLTPAHQAYFAKLGVDAQVIPFGYHAEFGQRLDLTRDVDVVFLGSLHDRRRSQLIVRLQAELDRRGIRIVIKDGSPERGYAYDDERTRLVNRSKILLNLMRQPWDDLVFRMLLAAANGALLITEPVVDTTPFEPGHHFVSAPLHELAAVIEHFVRAEDERARIATCAHDYVTRDLTIAQTARTLLASLADDTP